MTKIKGIRLAVMFASVLLLGAISTYAQATRTWVSGVGDDANPCSRTAPCKTFAGAISKTAAGGEIDALDPGGFGGVTITKSITLDGGGGQVGSVLVSGTNGITVVAGSSDVVTLRNLQINGIGSGLSGVRFNSGAVLDIQHCKIFNFSLNGIDVEVSSAADVIVADTTSYNNGGSGLYATSTGGVVAVTVERSIFEDNTAGVFAGSGSSVAVRDSAAGINIYGFMAQGSGAAMTMNIANSMASNNTSGGIAAGGLSANSTIRITGVSIFGNGAGLVILTHGTIASFGNNYNADSGTPNAHPTPQ
ncbi:MAG TPA: right-handed parallel beta-helix repeat-containing protein [Terriglobia bacterium]|nr:right-handed parallel beta-helix repeat-containing protein [Terriglobia bacterium]